MINTQKYHKLAFVQFQYPQSLITAVRDENRRSWGKLRIIVHPAKFDKPPPYSHHNPNLHLPPPPSKPYPLHKRNPTGNYTSALRGPRSYKEVTLPAEKITLPPHGKPQIDPCIPV